MAIYDCFTFYNEIDLLNLRLKRLNPYVDKFVLVELSRSFRGASKEKIFLNNINRFKDYKDKIIYISPEYVPEYRGDGDWTIEKYQRNCIMQGLVGCEPDDLILISDVDEFPNPDVIFSNPVVNMQSKYMSKRSKIRNIGYRLSLLSKEYIEDIKFSSKARLDKMLKYTPVTCEFDTYTYFLNCKTDAKTYCTTISRFENMFGPQAMRDRKSFLPVIHNAGWHFTYMGGLDRIKLKLSSIIDYRPEIQNKMKQLLDDDKALLEIISKGEDLYGRDGAISRMRFLKLEEMNYPDIKNIYKKYPELFNLLGQENGLQ